MKHLVWACCLALVLAAVPAWGETDVTGLWVSDFYGNKVECHLEQRGRVLYGVVYVNTSAGERNTYHVAGVVTGDHVRAQHGGGNYFDGEVSGDTASGTLYMKKSGISLAMQAKRIKHGKTVPGGLEWPAGLPLGN